MTAQLIRLPVRAGSAPDPASVLRRERDEALATAQHQAAEIERLLLEMDAERAHRGRQGVPWGPVTLALIVGAWVVIVAKGVGL